jgi:Ser-tRNA(Ala) deacylase AlaX
MTTNPAYHRDSYLTEIDTEITATGEADGRPWVVLADTIFYPEGGGQPSDRGTISGTTVIDVQRVEGKILHILERPLEHGTVHAELDWARRWDHMQQHTAQHLLTAVALADFGWRTTAFHLGRDVSDIELDVPRLEEAEIERLETAVMEEVRLDRTVSYRTAEVSDFEELGVRSRLLPEGFSGPVRLVEIAGIDLNTCGGTHLRSTREIGSICLLGSEPMRGGSRLFFVAGDRVRRRMRNHEKRNLALRTLLDSGDDDLAGVMGIRLAREKSLARANRVLAGELARHVATDLAASDEPVADGHWDDRDMDFLQTVARRFAEVAPAKRALLTASNEDGSVFVIVAGLESGLDLEAVGPEVAEVLGGRGGGRAPIFQGKAERLENRERALQILVKGMDSAHPLQ